MTSQNPPARTPQSGSTRGATVTAWDQPTRIFHWLLLALVISAYVSVEYAEDFGDSLLNWHRYNGLAILTLVVWRVLWGFAGSSTSRFKSFVPKPIAVRRYISATLKGAAPRYLGHNPLGSVMIIALLLALLTQTSLGLFSTDDDDFAGGPLSGFVCRSANKSATHWHAWVFWYVILPLAALHVTTNVLYGWLKKEPLITSMITGEKPAEPYVDARQATLVARPMVRAGVCLVVAAAIVFGGLWVVGGRL